MGFVDHHQIPGNARQRVCLIGRELKRADDRARLTPWAPGGAERAAIDDLAAQVEFVLELELPLRAQAGGADDQDPPRALCEKLGDDDSRLDRFSEAALVGEA